MKKFFFSLREAFLKLLFKRTVTILTVIFCIGILIVLGNLYYFSQQLIKNQALEHVSQSASSLKKARSLYNSDVVEVLKDVKNITIAHTYNHQSPNKTIPLPATYLRQLGSLLSEDEDGMKVRLYSNYPFPWREAEGKPQDNFEREAMKQLIRNPNTPFYKFEASGDNLTLRYAQAEVMKPRCIECHNTYPGTPKTDWKVGDVRGVLEISQSLKTTRAKVRQSLKMTTMGFSSLSVIGVASLVLAIRRLQSYSRQLEQRVRVRQQAMDEAFTQIHNGPLQTLALLLKDAQSTAKSEADFLSKLQGLNHEIREIGHNLTTEAETAESLVIEGHKCSHNKPKLRLGEGTLLDLTQPLHELFYETFSATLTRDFPYFKTIKIKARDFEPIPDLSLDLELKRDLCMWLEEAICNVGKHARGTTRIVAMGKEEAGKYVLKVQDNGSGLVASAKENYGTKSCNKLAERLQGNFRRESLSKKGTICELSWNINRR